VNGRALIYERKFSRSIDYRVEAYERLNTIGCDSCKGVDGDVSKTPLQDVRSG